MKTQTLTTSVTLGQEAIERLAAIVAGSDDGIIGKDLNGVITSWNAGAEKIFGYTAQEAMGRRIDFLLPPEHVEEEGFILVKILKGERVSHFQAERVCKGGQRITVSATVSPIFDASGKVVGASKIVRDITQQKKERLALLEANKELLFQIEAKAERAAELVIANEVKAQLEAVNIEKLNRSLMETIGIARQLVELRDPYTAGHEKHVGELAKAMAAELGFDTVSQEGVLIAGYLHDIGKIIIPAEILCKPGKLTPEEFNLIKNHVQAGYELLKNVNFSWNIARAVLEHHERLDGSGYPNHLKGDEISIQGRILAVADVVEAMSAYRPYRPALGIDLALAEIERGRGVIYDETVVDVCIKLFREDGYALPSASA
jgi:PAS domain S-box-containing protein/putative nucleotidyltransferase with HDIG domain